MIIHAQKSETEIQKLNRFPVPPTDNTDYIYKLITI